MNITLALWKINLINKCQENLSELDIQKLFLKNAYSRHLKVGIWKIQMKEIGVDLTNAIFITPFSSFTCHYMTFSVSKWKDSLLLKSCKATKSHEALRFFPWALLVFIKCFSYGHAFSVLWIISWLWLKFQKGVDFHISTLSGEFEILKFCYLA